MTSQRLFKQPMTAIKVPGKHRRERRMRVRHALAFVKDVRAESARGELQLALDELLFVAPMEKEAHEHVTKEAIVKIAQHFAHTVEAPDLRDHVPL